jgi:hypothetical protein
MNRWNWTRVAVLAVFVVFVVLVAACSSIPKKEWRKAGMEVNSEAMREQRAKDVADCTTRAGAPTQGVQSTLSYSRAQIADCMHARGWREVSIAE